MAAYREAQNNLRASALRKLPPDYDYDDEITEEVIKRVEKMVKAEDAGTFKPNKEPAW